MSVLKIARDAMKWTRRLGHFLTTSWTEGDRRRYDSNPGWSASLEAFRLLEKKYLVPALMPLLSSRIKAYHMSKRVVA